jgi:hypothetical protein
MIWVRGRIWNLQEIRTGFEKGKCLRDEDVKPTVILLKLLV